MDRCIRSPFPLEKLSSDGNILTTVTVAGNTGLKDDKQGLLCCENTHPEACTDCTGKCSIVSQWTGAAFHLNRDAMRKGLGGKALEEKDLHSSVTEKEEGEDHGEKQSLIPTCPAELFSCS